MINKAALLCLLLLSSALANADMLFSLGTGQHIFDRSGIPFERVGAIGYQHPFATDLFVRPEIGYFNDISGNGQSSGWATTILGVRSQSALGPEAHIGVGPSYLQNTDQILGGHFQFSLEGGVGLTDQAQKVNIGIAWKHMSSAGLEMPNHGRDFIVVQLRLLNI